MQITVNGSPHEIETQINLQQLLERLEIGKGRIAVELNGEILPKSCFAQQSLKHGDSIEIVQAIGGG